MSQIVHIKGEVKIKNLELAKECIEEMSVSGLKIENDQFVFNEYDYSDGFGKDKLIKEIEAKYREKYANFQKELIIKNAKESGYKVKKEITEDKKVKLVFLKRTY